MRPEPVEGAIFHIQSDNTNAFAILHDKIQCKVFDEELSVVSERLTIKSVKKSMARAVSGSGAAVCLTTLAEFERLATERALIDLALLRT